MTGQVKSSVEQAARKAGAFTCVQEPTGFWVVRTKSRKVVGRGAVPVSAWADAADRLAKAKARGKTS